MRIFATLVASIACLDIAFAQNPSLLKRLENLKKDALARHGHPMQRRDDHEHFDGPPKTRFLTNKTKEFAVDASKLPFVDFELGESYAGLLPLTGEQNETRKYFFWFWPSLNQTGPKEIAIWLNGGPGCSSLLGFLTENGPFTWKDGTARPVKNTYDWRNLTNVMWVEQPLGVGFNQGKPNITNELELAQQFVGFYEQFAKTFDVKGWDIYLTGESYAGVYVPYIANEFITRKNPDMPLKAVHINNPIIGSDMTQQAATVVPFSEHWRNVLGYNDTISLNLTQTHEQCGYKSFLDEYFTFPAPQKIFPKLKELEQRENYTDPCDTLYRVAFEGFQMNPCFNFYRITSTCPYSSSALSPVSEDLNPTPDWILFNRTDVQTLLHVPVGTAWFPCANEPVFPDKKDPNNTSSADLSPPPAHNGVLQNVIEKTGHVIIGSGNLDALLNTNGTLLAIQNMTWNGWQGLKEYPGKPFFSPFHEDLPGSPAAGGYLGNWGHERGLTFYQIHLAGHMVPGEAPGGSYRIMELLLGRIAPDDLGKQGNFTTEKGNG